VTRLCSLGPTPSAASGSLTRAPVSMLPQKRHLIASSWIISAQNGHFRIVPSIPERGRTLGLYFDGCSLVARYSGRRSTSKCSRFVRGERIVDVPFGMRNL
jgi:hypothetical protein